MFSPLTKRTDFVLGERTTETAFSEGTDLKDCQGQAYDNGTSVIGK